MSEPRSVPVTDPAQTHETAKWKHDRPLTACRFDPTGKYLFTGAEDHHICRWELATGNMLRFAGHDSWVRAIGFSKDGQTLYSGGFDGKLCWQPATANENPQPSRTVEAHAGWLRALADSPDGTRIATCGNDHLVKLWNTEDGQLVHTLAGHESHVYNVAFHPHGQFVVSCDLKGNIKQWDCSEGKLVRDFAAAALYKYDTQFRADIGGARSMTFAPDGSRFAVAGITNVSNAFAGIGNACVVVFDWNTGQISKTHTAKEAINGVAWGVRLHPAGYTFAQAGGGGGGYFYFWKTDEEKEFFRFKLPASARDCDLHPDGRQVAVAHVDNHVRLYLLDKKA
jgi:WD40 repeat protein